MLFTWGTLLSRSLQISSLFLHILTRGSSWWAQDCSPTDWFRGYVTSCSTRPWGPLFSFKSGLWSSVTPAEMTFLTILSKLVPTAILHLLTKLYFYSSLHYLHIYTNLSLLFSILVSLLEHKLHVGRYSDRLARSWENFWASGMGKLDKKIKQGKTVWANCIQLVNCKTICISPNQGHWEKWFIPPLPNRRINT